MRKAGVYRWFLAAVLGVGLLTAAGCMGGSKNFSPARASIAQAASDSSGDPTRLNVGPKIGNLAPDFTLKALDGSLVTLSELKGKTVFVNFWATWCPPCKQEMPDLEKAYQKTRDQGIAFLGVNLKEDAGTVQKFVNDNGYHWTILLDSTGQTADSYQVSGIPTSFFIDRNGVVRDMQIGPITEPLLEAKLAKMQ